MVSGRALAALAVAAGVLVSASMAVAAEKSQTTKPLVFKSRVINAPGAANASVIADALQKFYAARKPGSPARLSETEHLELLANVERAFRLNRSSEGLHTAQAGGGMTRLDLDGRFQYVILSKTNPDGSTSTACVTDWDQARAFFEGDSASPSVTK
jgi:hypothetical protein